MKDNQGNAGRAQAASDFASQHPGGQPSDYYSNGDSYQDMRSGWIGCMTIPTGLVVLVALLVVLL